MCGVQVAGERHFLIAPVPGGHFTHATFSYKSIYGTVCSSWEKEENGIRYTVVVPSNCTAKVVVGKETKDLAAGEYSFTV